MYFLNPSTFLYFPLNAASEAGIPDINANNINVQNGDTNNNQSVGFEIIEPALIAIPIHNKISPKSTTIKAQTQANRSGYINKIP